MTTIVNVTQADIDNGRMCNCSQCPVALALKRALPDAYVVVQGYTVLIDGVRYWMTPKMNEFIKTYDTLGIVEPFEFDLDEITSSRVKDFYRDFPYRGFSTTLYTEVNHNG